MKKSELNQTSQIFISSAPLFICVSNLFDSVFLIVLVTLLVFMTSFVLFVLRSVISRQIRVFVSVFLSATFLQALITIAAPFYETQAEQLRISAPAILLSIFLVILFLSQEKVSVRLKTRGFIYFCGLLLCVGLVRGSAYMGGSPAIIFMIFALLMPIYFKLRKKRIA